MGTLDGTPYVGKQVCRLAKLTAPFTGPHIRDEVNAVLNEGWHLVEIDTIGGNNFAVFVRPKRQAD